MKRQMMKAAVGLVIVMGALVITSGNAKADPDCLPDFVDDYDCSEANKNTGKVCQKVGGEPLPTLIQVDLDGDCKKEKEYNMTEWREHCFLSSTHYVICDSIYFKFVRNIPPQ